MEPRHLQRRIGITLLELGLTSASAFACSIQLAPRVAVAPDSVIFVGRVTDYEEPISMDGCLPGEKYAGLSVAVDWAFAGPSLEGKSIKLFPYDLAAYCGAQPLKMDALKSRYHLGARVRVVAELHNPCHGAELPSSADALLLFASTFHGGIAVVTPSDPDPATAGAFDYSRDAGTRTSSRGNAVDFEVVKDLVRLAGARTEEERVSIIRRLSLLPVYRGRWCEELVKANIASDVEALRLSESCAEDNLDVQP
jgi:hypothetical protein